MLGWLNPFRQLTPEEKAKKNAIKKKWELKGERNTMENGHLQTYLTPPPIKSANKNSLRNERHPSGPFAGPPTYGGKKYTRRQSTKRRKTRRSRK